MDQNINQYVDALFTNMENFSQKDGMIGKPVTQGDKTFLPIMSITLGYGGGDTQSKAKTTSGASGTTNTGGGMMGGALGIGAKLATDAVLVIDKGNVLMASINPPGGMGQVLDKIPQIINSMNQGSAPGGQAGQPAQPGSPGSQPGAQPNKGMS